MLVFLVSRRCFIRQFNNNTLQNNTTPDVEIVAQGMTLFLYL